MLLALIKRNRILCGKWYYILPGIYALMIILLMVAKIQYDMVSSGVLLKVGLITAYILPVMFMGATRSFLQRHRLSRSYLFLLLADIVTWFGPMIFMSAITFITYTLCADVKLTKLFLIMGSFISRAIGTYLFLLLLLKVIDFIFLKTVSIQKESFYWFFWVIQWGLWGFFMLKVVVPHEGSLKILALDLVITTMMFLLICFWEDYALPRLWGYNIVITRESLGKKEGSHEGMDHRNKSFNMAMERETFSAWIWWGTTLKKEWICSRSILYFSLLFPLATAGGRLLKGHGALPWENGVIFLLVLGVVTPYILIRQESLLGDIWLRQKAAAWKIMMIKWLVAGFYYMAISTFFLCMLWGVQGIRGDGLMDFRFTIASSILRQGKALWICFAMLPLGMGASFTLLYEKSTKRAIIQAAGSLTILAAALIYFYGNPSGWFMNDVFSWAVGIGLLVCGLLGFLWICRQYDQKTLVKDGVFHEGV